MIDLSKKYHFKKFSKEQRSSFRYWYYHWKAYNLVALNLRCWKLKYLFHDIEKPWLRLFMSYDKVQKFHRRNNAHHLQYKHQNKINWEAMVIDWECSRFTKAAAPLTARETMIMKIEKDSNYKELLMEHMLPILNKFEI